MKVVLSKNDGKGSGSVPRPAILPLQPEEEDAVPKHLLRSFDLLTDVGDAASPKHRVYSRVLDGTESARTTIKWRHDINKILDGLNLTTTKVKGTFVQELLTGAAQSAYLTGLRFALAKEKLSQANAAVKVIADAGPASDSDADKRAHIAAMTAAKNGVINKDDDHVDFYTDAVIKEALDGIVTHAVPMKALQVVKRYLRRDCRKPATMKVRDYYTHLQRINNEEIPYLPPHQGATQKLSDDELADILLCGVPKSWVREMDRQGKDPVLMNIAQLVLFLEQIELAEDFDPNKVNNGNKSNKGKKGKSNQKGGNTNNNSGNGEYHCALHGDNNTHSTDDCRTIKQQVKRLKNKSSGGGKSNNSNKSNNDWKNKANNNKNKASKELNAVAKKVAQESAKAVVKELNAAGKKRKSDDSDDEHSVNAIEQALFENEVHALEMEFANEDFENLTVNSDDDVSC